MHGKPKTLDQAVMPLVDALIAAQAASPASFGAPGHKRGAAMPAGLRALLGRKVFRADMLSPKGLDDRTESLHALQRAHEIAAEAWGADLCRFSTGGSTQSIQTALATVARPGETVLIAGNSHKAVWAAALYAGLDLVPVAPAIRPDWDLEHGLPAATVAAALDAYPHARALLVVSPTYYGVTGDIAELARLCHARAVPLIVDAAWGGAFGFASVLPQNPLAAGADIMVASLHKTMGALAQGSVILSRGEFVDQQRLALAYELFQTTSPSVPILASLDATRAEHARDGERIWKELMAVADEVRAALAKVEGVRVLGPEMLDGDGAFDLDRTKITVDLSALGVASYAADDWLFKERGLIAGLSDGRHLLGILSPGTRAREAAALSGGVAALAAALRRDPGLLPRAPDLPRLSDLRVEVAMAAADAFFAPAEPVRYEEAAGRIAAEIIAPAPPGVPRLMPGQRITDAHVAWLVAHRDAGMFVLDPADPSQKRLRVVA